MADMIVRRFSDYFICFSEVYILNLNERLPRLFCELIIEIWNTPIKLFLLQQDITTCAKMGPKKEPRVTVSQTKETITAGISTSATKSIAKRHIATTATAEPKAKLLRANDNSNSDPWRDCIESTKDISVSSLMFIDDVTLKLQLFKARKVEIFINGHCYEYDETDQNTYSKFFKAFMIENTDIYTTIRNELLSQPLKGSSDRVFNVELLQDVNESKFQEWVTSDLCRRNELNNYKILDTHIQEQGLSVTSCCDGLFSFGAHPHVTSTALPMTLMFASKHDHVNIIPGLDRIWAQLSFTAALSKVIVFVTTGYFSWCMHLERFTSNNGGFGERLNIFSVTPEQLDYLWTDITIEAESHNGRDYYLTEDGLMIYSALHEMGLSCINCRITYKAGINSKVYAITLPNEKLVISALEPTWAIKVVKDGRAFQREINALRKVKTAWINEKIGRDFYALSVFDFSEKSFESWMSDEQTVEVERFVEIAQTIFAEKRKSKANMTAECWWNTLGDVRGKGGAILMKFSQITLSQSFSNEEPVPTRIYNQVIESLQVAHSVNICHCDIRSSNVMYFDDGWQLIDFDLSCNDGDEINLNPGSAQFEYSPDDVRKQDYGVFDDYPLQVVWTKKYDDKMAIVCFFDKRSYF
eukprot:gene6383-12907_t